MILIFDPDSWHSGERIKYFQCGSMIDDDLNTSIDTDIYLEKRNKLLIDRKGCDSIFSQIIIYSYQYFSQNSFPSSTPMFSFMCND